MQTEKNKALEHAEKSFQLYTDSVLKSEAARMTGYIHIQNNDYAKAILYLKNADKLTPKDYYTWKLLLQSYIATKSPETATMTENLYMLDPKNYNIYNDLMSIYYTTDETQLPQLLHLFKTQLKQQTSNTVLLNLNFAIGNAEFHTGDKKNAKTYLLKAKELIAQESDPDEEMSEVLDDLILRCK